MKRYLLALALSAVAFLAHVDHASAAGAQVVIPAGTGAAGADGKTVRNGAGAPSAGLGVDGDFYVDTTAHSIYGPKASGAWGSSTSLVGPTGSAGSNGTNGADGLTVRNGSGVPSAGLGVNGDFYIDTTAHSIYGPKTAGAWGSSTSLVGPTGSAGSNGTNGTNGTNGSNAPGGLVLISQSTLSGTVTSIDFTSGINSTYDEYELRFQNLTPSTNNDALWLRTTADGSTWNSTAGDYFWDYTENGSNTAGTSGSETKIVLTAGNISNTTANGGISGSVRFYAPAGTTQDKVFAWAACFYFTSPSVQLKCDRGGGIRISTAAIVGVRLLFSTGNAASGAVKLYGVNKT